MPIKTYRKKPIEVQTLTWDGTNTDEVIAFMGDDFIAKGIYGIEFKLKEPNHYGHTSLLLTKGSTMVKYEDGSLSNGGLYDPNNWDLIKDKKD